MVEYLCTELDKRFVEGENAGKTADLADWIEFGMSTLLFNEPSIIW